MAPKKRSAKKMVIESTKKVVQETVQVKVIESDRKRNRQETNILLLNEEYNGQEHSVVKTIAVEEKTPEENKTANDKEAKKTTMKKVEEKKEKKKRKRGGKEEYKRYVFMVLKQVHPGMGISSKAMTVVNNMMNDMFERLVGEAAKLTMYTGKMTLTSREIQSAVRLVLPGELGRHAVAEGAKAVATFMDSNGEA
ncbi:hypothetical protein UlMin_012594 [Ulmus minor]